MEPIKAEERLARLGQLIQERRLQLDMSKRAVSAAAGISINTYQRVEAGFLVRDLTYGKIEDILKWAAGSCRAILDGAEGAVTIEPTETGVVMAKDLDVHVRQAVSVAAVAVTESLTAREIRDLTDRVLDELRDRGLIE